MSRFRRATTIVACALVIYVVLAYVALPLAWRHYEHQPKLAEFSAVTRTGQDIPGDPLNVGLVGSREEVLCAMNGAGWFPADPITLRSSIEIIGSVLLDRPYHNAPVSALYFLGRREDLAFEKPVGVSAGRRNHVRFWKALDQGAEGRPVWLGAATLDRSVGFSRDTGQVTHHIAADIDAERTLLIGDLKSAKAVEATYEVTGIGPTINGRNGEGDLYYTDGEIVIARLAQGCRTKVETPVRLDNPVPVKLKNRIWRTALRALRSVF